MSADAAQHLVTKHVAAAQDRCPALKRKRVSPHVMRHTAAMELLQSGIEPTVIAASQRAWLAALLAARQLGAAQYFWWYRLRGSGRNNL
jgi:site-specific recombinase XerD